MTDSTKIKYKRIGNIMYATWPATFVDKFTDLNKHPLLKLDRPEPGKHYATCCATHAGTYQECYEYES